MSIFAQKKTIVELSAGVKKSIGKDVIKTFFSAENPVRIDYFSKKKFEHPYLELSADILRTVTSKLSMGLKTGLYFHFSEIYTTGAERTTIAVPLQLSGKYLIRQFKKKSIGIALSSGVIFFEINEKTIEKYKNGVLFNSSFFYSAKRSIVKIGIEKEIDYATFYINSLSPFFSNEKFNYSINRLSLTLSYGILIK